MTLYSTVITMLRSRQQAVDDQHSTISQCIPLYLFFILGSKDSRLLERLSKVFVLSTSDAGNLHCELRCNL